MTADTALLLLDYQVALAQEGDLCLAPPLAAQVRERDVVATASRVLAAARAAGVLVIHVRLAFDPTYRLRTNRLPRFEVYPANGRMLAGSPEAEIVAPLAPLDGEPVVDKGCVDPFVGTPLRDVLAAEGIGARGARRHRHPPRRRVRRPARLRQRLAGERRRGHVRRTRPRAARARRHPNPAALRLGVGPPTRSSGAGHERGATTSSSSGAASPASRPRSRPARTVPASRCSSGRSRRRPAATRATPRPTCG